MKQKTARRFLNRSRWRIARQDAAEAIIESPSWNKRIRKAKTVLGDPRFRIFDFLK